MPTRKSKVATAAPQRPAPAMRLIFEYEGDNLRLISQQPVDVALAGAEFAQQPSAGTFIDVRDAGNLTLARVHARGMSTGSVEVFPEKPGEPITRIAVDRPKGAFTVLMPAPPTAARVAVVRVTHGTALAAGGASLSASASPSLESQELGSFALQLKP